MVADNRAVHLRRDFPVYQRDDFYDRLFNLRKLCCDVVVSSSCVCAPEIGRVLGWLSALCVRSPRIVCVD